MSGHKRANVQTAAVSRFIPPEWSELSVRLGIMYLSVKCHPFFVSPNCVCVCVCVHAAARSPVSFQAARVRRAAPPLAGYPADESRENLLAFEPERERKASIPGLPSI